jgi:hypothetical protein
MDVPAVPRPVLMIPLRRCGSHAIRLRLNLNPDFHAPYPLHIVDFVPLLPGYGDLNHDDNYFQLIVDLVGLQAVSMIKWDVILDPVTLFDNLRNESRNVHRIAWEMLREAARCHGARVVMDKSLDSVHYAEEMMRTLPDLLFLNVVRDPRAQVASMNRAIIHDFDSLLNAQTWLRAHRAADRVAAAFPQRVLTVRYEDFVDRQAETLDRICRFLGIAFGAEMLDVENSAEAQQISVRSALWSANASAPIPANKQKFLQQLGSADVEIIETITGLYMDRYGYERVTSGAAPVLDSTIAAARRRSDELRARAWSDLRRSNFIDYCLRMKRREYLDGIARRQESAQIRETPARIAGAP